MRTVEMKCPKCGYPCRVCIIPARGGYGPLANIFDANCYCDLSGITSTHIFGLLDLQDRAAAVARNRMKFSFVDEAADMTERQWHAILESTGHTRIREIIDRSRRQVQFAMEVHGLNPDFKPSKVPDTLRELVEG